MKRRQKIIIASMLALGVSMFVLAALAPSDNRADSALSIDGVEGLIPERGDEVLQQQNVGIDLEPGYRLVGLTISEDGRCLFPVDVLAETNRIDGLEQWIYTPGQGKPVEALSPEANCVRATIEQVSRPGEYEEIEWAFTVS